MKVLFEMVILSIQNTFSFMNKKMISILGLKNGSSGPNMGNWLTMLTAVRCCTNYLPIIKMAWDYFLDKTIFESKVCQQYIKVYTLKKVVGWFCCFTSQVNILSYQGLQLSNLTLGLTALIFSDWIRHKPKIVTINMINHKAVQKFDKHQASR